MSGVFQNIEPPPPLYPESVSDSYPPSPPPPPKAPGGEGEGFGRRQTLDWPLTVLSLYVWRFGYFLSAAEFFGLTGRKVLPRVGNITAKAKPNIAQVVGKMGSLFNAVTDGMAVV